MLSLEFEELGAGIAARSPPVTRLAISIPVFLASLVLGPQVLAEDVLNCTERAIACQNNCVTLNAGAKDPKYATQACQNNCGRQWKKNCAQDTGEGGGIVFDEPQTTQGKTPIHGGSSGAVKQ
jgi:hypothetical protein